MEEAERTEKVQRKSYSHVVSGLPPQHPPTTTTTQLPNPNPAGLPPLQRRSTGSTPHGVNGPAAGQMAAGGNEASSREVDSLSLETTNFQRNRNTLPKARQRQGAPNIQIEDVQYSTRIITNSSRRGSQRGGQSYRGHSHGSYEQIRGSHDNVQQRFRSQEQLRGQRSYDNVGTGGEYNQPARSFSHSRRGGGGQGYYQNDRQNSREQIYHSQGHLPPTGRRFRSRSRHGGQSGSKSRGQTGSGERKQDNKPSTLPRPKRSYDREPIYNYNNNSRPGTLPRNYRERSGGDRKISRENQGSGSLRRIYQAPSQRRISKQREASSRKESLDRHQRARSLPKQLIEPQTIFPMSLSSNTIWRPDGKCPSFADMLKNKKNSGASEIDLKGHEEEILESGQQHKSEINLHQTESVTPHAAQEGAMHQSQRNISPPSDENVIPDRSAQIQQDVSFHVEQQSSQEFVHLHSTPAAYRDATLENVDEGSECKSPDVALQWEVVQTSDVPDITFDDQSRTTFNTEEETQPDNTEGTLNIMNFQSNSTSYFSEQIVTQTFVQDTNLATSNHSERVLNVEQVIRNKSDNTPSGMGYVEDTTTETVVETPKSPKVSSKSAKTKVVVTPPMDNSSGKEDSSETKFWQVKSYANILSEGLSKVKGVFKKSKENLKSSDESETKQSKLTTPAQFNTVPTTQTKSAPPTPKVSRIHTEIKLRSTPNPHPDIPGLLFKREIERKNSKKKRRSKIFEAEKVSEELSKVSNSENDIFQQEAIKENVIKVEKEVSIDNYTASQQTTSVDNVEVIINKDIKLEKSLPREFTKASSTSGSTNNTLRKRSKKKLSKEIHEVKKFNDEVDQALYEIQLMEEEKAKRKSFHGGEVSIQTLIKPTTIKPKRGSKKSRKLGRALPYQSSLDEGNAADDELEKDADLEAQPTQDAEKSDEVTMDDIKESQVDIERCDEVISFKSDEIMCLPEDDNTPRSSPLDVISPLGITEHLSSGIEVMNVDNNRQETVESPDVSLNQSIDTIEEMSSEEEKELKEMNKSQIDNELTKQETVTKAEIKDDKQGLQYSQDWMIDDVGAIEDSDEEQESPVKETEQNVIKSEAVEEKKGLEYSQDWMIDDVGAIEDSDDEQESPAKLTEQNVEKSEIPVTETSNNISDLKEEEKKGLEYSQDWMIDDVGAIEDSDEEQEAPVKVKEHKVEQPEVLVTEKSTTVSEPQEDQKKGLEYSQDWMIDDVGAIEDSDDEQEAPVKETEKNVVKSDDISTVTPTTVLEEKKGLEYSQDWMIDDVGAIEDSDDEQESPVKVTELVVEQSEVLITEKSTTVSDPKVDQKKVLEYSQDWMIDDVGAIEDSDEEQEAPAKITDQNVVKSEVMSTAPSSTVVEEKKGLEYSLDWMIDDVGAIEDSDEEQEAPVKEASEVPVTETSTKVSDLKNEEKKGLEYSQDWMIDDVGALEDSDEEQEAPAKVTEEIVVKSEDISTVKQSTVVEEKKGLEYSQDWMIDDVGAIEDSEDESEATKQNERAEIKTALEEVKIEEKKGLEYSQDWMIDDVGAIEDSDDEEVADNKNNKLNKSEEKKQGVTYSEYWMMDDVGTIESSDEEWAKETSINKKEEIDKIKDSNPLALPAPKYSDIASKLPKVKATEEEQKPASEVIAVGSHYKPIIYTEEKIESNKFYDPEGYTSVIRKRKKSSRVSINEDTLEKYEFEDTKEKNTETNHLSESEDEIEIIDLSNEICDKQPEMDLNLKCYSASCRSGGQCYSSSCPANIIKAVSPLMEGRISAMELAQRFSMDEEEFEDLKGECTKEEIEEAEETSWSYVLPGKSSTNLDVQEKTIVEKSSKKKYIKNASDDKHYMIDVKVTTKETILGHKLHQQDSPEWKMDVQCVQHDSCPDIIETSTNVVNTNQKQDDSIVLAPSWMRKAVTENERKKNEQPSVVAPRHRPVIKQKPIETADEKDNENKDENEEVYWRIKYKVKKKKKRNRSSTSQTSDLSLSGGESVTNSLKKSDRPSYLASRSDTIDVEVGSNASSFDHRDIDIDEHLNSSEPSVYINHPDSICIEEERRGSVTQDLSSDAIESANASERIEFVNKKLSSCSEVSIIENETTIKNDIHEEHVAAEKYEENKTATIEIFADVQESLESINSVEMAHEDSAKIRLERPERKISSCSNVDVNELEVDFENTNVEQQNAIEEVIEITAAVVEDCVDVHHSLQRMKSITIENENAVNIVVEQDLEDNHVISSEVNVNNNSMSETKMLEATNMIRSVSPQNRKQKLERQVSNEMLDATQVPRCPSPKNPVSFSRQTSREMEKATEVLRPIRKLSQNYDTDQQESVIIKSEIVEVDKSHVDDELKIDTADIDKDNNEDFSTLPALEEVLSAEAQASSYDMQKLELAEAAYFERLEKERQSEIQNNSNAASLDTIREESVIAQKETTPQVKSKKSKKVYVPVESDKKTEPNLSIQNIINQFEASTAVYDISKLIEAEVKYFEYLDREAKSMKDTKITAEQDSIKILEKKTEKITVKQNTSNTLAKDNFNLDTISRQVSETQFFSVDNKKVTSFESKNTSVDEDYTWSDETTLLGGETLDTVDGEENLAASLPVLAKQKKDSPEFESEEKIVSKIKVRLFDLSASVSELEVQMKELEDLQGQLSVVEFLLGKIDDLVAETKNIETSIEELSSERQTDKQNLLVELSRARTSLIKLEGEAKHKRTDMEAFMKHRRRRVEDIKMYQGILVDLEVWLEDVLRQLNADLRLTDLRVVKDQIRGCQVLEEDLRQRVDQLSVLSGNISGLAGAPDVSGLAEDMTGRLALLREAMARTQTGLKSRLSRLQV